MDVAAWPAAPNQDGRWRVTLPQVPAHELSARHAVALTAGGQTATAELSALSWARSAIKTYGADSAGGRCAAAIWQYSQAADAVMDSRGV